MKRLLLATILLLLSTATTLLAEEVPDAWHRATGEATASTEAEALRLAKASALESIFTALGKDDLFVSLLLSSFPRGVVEGAVASSVAEQRFTATVEVGVDPTAVALTAPRYEGVVAETLNQAEADIRRGEERLIEAEQAAGGLDYSTSSELYGQAGRLGERALARIRDIGDPAVQSDSGATVVTLRERGEILSSEAEAALQDEAARDAAAREAAARQVPAAGFEEDEAADGRDTRANRATELAWWSVSRRPQDTLIFRWEPRLLVDHRDGSSRLPRAGFSLTGQYLFESGIYLGTTVALEERSYGGDLSQRGLSQEATFALRHDGARLLGVGFRWDWQRSLLDRGDRWRLEPESEAQLVWGQGDPNLPRPAHLIRLGYPIPRVDGELYPLYHLSGELSAVAYLENVLKLSGRFSSRPVRLSPRGPVDSLNAYQHELSWEIGGGVRFPRPATLGVLYGETHLSAYTDDGLADAFHRVQRGWRFYLEYAY